MRLSFRFPLDQRLPPVLISVNPPWGDVASTTREAVGFVPEILAV